MSGDYPSGAGERAAWFKDSEGNLLGGRQLLLRIPRAAAFYVSVGLVGSVSR